MDYNDEDATKKVVDGTGNGGVQAVIVCTDSVAATEWSLKILRHHGVCVALGLPTDGFHFDAFDLMFKELSVKGSLVANKKLLDDMMRVVAAHGVKSLIHTVDLGDEPRLPEMHMEHGLQGRLVVKM